MANRRGTGSRSLRHTPIARRSSRATDRARRPPHQFRAPCPESAAPGRFLAPLWRTKAPNFPSLPVSARVEVLAVNSHGGSSPPPRTGAETPVASGGSGLLSSWAGVAAAAAAGPALPQSCRNSCPAPWRAPVAAAAAASSLSKAPFCGSMYFAVVAGFCAHDVHDAAERGVRPLALVGARAVPEVVVGHLGRLVLGDAGGAGSFPDGVAVVVGAEDEPAAGEDRVQRGAGGLAQLQLAREVLLVEWAGNLGPGASLARQVTTGGRGRRTARPPPKGLTWVRPHDFQRLPRLLLFGALRCARCHDWPLRSGIASEDDSARNASIWCFKVAAT
jgi:hypothetical protein